MVFQRMREAQKYFLVINWVLTIELTPTEGEQRPHKKLVRHRVNNLPHTHGRLGQHPFELFPFWIENPSNSINSMVNENK